MNEHLSALDFDEIAAGFTMESVREHATKCADCRTHLARISANREAVMADPRFAMTFARLPTAPRNRRWTRWIAAAVASGACVALVLLLPNRTEMRPKGGRPGLTLISAEGRPMTMPRVGDIVELRANPEPHPFALIVAVGTSPSSTTVLWPLETSHSGRIAAGSYASIRLQVTPGPVKIVAAFSDQPLGLSDALPPRSRPGVEFCELAVKPTP